VKGNDMTTFNYIDTAHYDQATVERFRALRPLSDESLGIGAALPSVDNKGNVVKTGVTKKPGVTALQLAMRASWHDGGSVYGCGQSEIAAAVLPSPVTGRVDYKLNNIKGLARLGLIQVYMMGLPVSADARWAGPFAVTLTEAGLATVKRNAPDLAKAAKGYTSTAYEKAAKAATAKPKKAKAKPVDSEPVEADMGIYGDSEHEQARGAAYEAALDQPVDADLSPSGPVA
jgi:hypothetical protein